MHSAVGGSWFRQAGLCCSLGAHWVLARLGWVWPCSDRVWLNSYRWDISFQTQGPSWRVSQPPRTASWLCLLGLSRLRTVPSTEPPTSVWSSQSLLLRCSSSQVRTSTTQALHANGAVLGSLGRRTELAGTPSIGPPRPDQASLLLALPGERSPRSEWCLDYKGNKLALRHEYLHCFWNMLLPGCLLQGLDCCLRPLNQLLLQCCMICLFVSGHLFSHLFWVIEVHRNRKLLDCSVFPSF